MLSVTEGAHDGGSLVSEANGDRSREEIVVVAGQSLQAGAVRARPVTFEAVHHAALGRTSRSIVSAISSCAFSRS